jgi:VanZ family protein
LRGRLARMIRAVVYPQGRGLALRVSAFLPVAVWAGIIFALSATPNLRVAESDTLDLIMRKAGHMAAFGILALLIWRALRIAGPVSAPEWLAPALALLLTAAYAASDEFHQSFTSGRRAAFADFSIDVIGAVVAVLAVVCLRWFAARAGSRGD